MGSAFRKKLARIQVEKSTVTRPRFGRTERTRSSIWRIGCSSLRRGSSPWSMPYRPRVPATTSQGNCCAAGTSPFANHGEVQAAESRKDFIHKLGVCHKELKEIKRWLRLIARVELLSPKRVRLLLLETEELIRIFSASIRTAEKNAT